jgi:hypothetical protein
MSNKKHLTCSEHEVLAARVKAARDLLDKIYLEVANALGPTAKASKLAGKSRSYFHQFKTEISNVADRDCPELDSMDLYFGSTAHNKVVHLAEKPK